MTAGLVTASSLVATAAETQLPLPDVTVMAPGPANAPPYLRDPSNSYGRNPYLGRLRVEEDKFARVPCSDTRIAAISGGSCLQGYKFDIGSNASQSPAARGSCDLALDVTMFENARLTAEAAVLIFDPYKVTALGNTSSRCHVSGFLGYGVVDFVDMNQVTRRGTNFRNMAGAGDDKSIEFDVDGHHCKAIRHTGPRWQGGYVYIGYISICRTDAAQVQSEDVAYVFNTLRVRVYDSQGNLRRDEPGGAATSPSVTSPTLPGSRQR